MRHVRPPTLTRPQRLNSLELRQVSGLCRRAHPAPQGRRRLHLHPPNAAGALRRTIRGVLGRSHTERQAIPDRNRNVSRVSATGGERPGFAYETHEVTLGPPCSMARNNVGWASPTVTRGGRWARPTRRYLLSGSRDAKCSGSVVPNQGIRMGRKQVVGWE